MRITLEGCPETSVPVEIVEEVYNYLKGDAKPRPFLNAILTALPAFEAVRHARDADDIANLGAISLFISNCVSVNARNGTMIYLDDRMTSVQERENHVLSFRIALKHDYNFDLDAYLND